METNNINTIQMIRLIRDHQYELTKNMTDEEKIDFFHKQAVAFMRQLEERIEGRQQKTMAVEHLVTLT